MFSKIALSAVILAGGDSKRMGTDKAFLTLNNQYLVDLIFNKLENIFEEIMIVTDRVNGFRHLNVKVISDIFKDSEKNALRGIHSGLFNASTGACFFIACDMPFLSQPLIYHMSKYALQYDAVIPRIEGYFQPLFAFYNITALSLITSSLKQKSFKIIDFYSGLKIKEINEETVTRYDPEMLSFFNINTLEDYERAKALFRKCPRKNSY